MPLTAEQLDNWFTYHPPTEETAPKYAAILGAASKCMTLIRSAIDTAKSGTMPKGAACEYVNAATREFAVAIDSLAPDSADKSAAIRCVRLARNAANEAITNGHDEDAPREDHPFRLRGRDYLTMLSLEQVTAARWRANSAIACGGK